MKNVLRNTMGVTAILVAVLLAFAVPGVHAAGNSSCGGGICLFDPLNGCDFTCLTGKIIDFLLNVGFILVPAMALVAGFQILTAGGKPEKASTGKKTLLYTAIGAGVLLIAKGIGLVIQSVLKP